MNMQNRLSAYARQLNVQVYPSQYGRLAWVRVGSDRSALPVALWNVNQWATPRQCRRAWKNARKADARIARFYVSF